MTKECTEMHNKFYHHFRYFPEVPFDVIMERPEASTEFCEVIKRCIETGIDETIEKYGTEPPTEFEFPDEFIDDYD